MARGKKTSDSVSAAKEKRAAGVTAKKRAPSAATAATVATSSSSNGKVQKRGKKTVGSAAAAAALAESSGTKATRSGNHRPLGTYGEALLTKAELRAFGKMRGIERMPTPVLLKTCELIVETFDDIQVQSDTSITLSFHVLSIIRLTLYAGRDCCRAHGPCATQEERGD